MSWKEEKVYINGDDYYQDLTREIEKASKRVYVESYIFDLDSLGISLLEALMAASDRGVKTHLLVDGVGSLHYFSNYRERLIKSNLKVRVYNPAPGFFHLLQFLMFWTSNFRVLLRALSFLNRRNHRKLILIDDEIIFTGGRNISALHSERFYGEKAWRDTSVKLVGGPVSIASEAHERAWRKSVPLEHLSRLHIPRLPRRQTRRYHPLIRINDSFRQRLKGYRDLLRRMRQSRERIWLCTPYFVPRRSMLRLLLKKAASGKDVRILIPSKSDVFFMPWVNSSFYVALLKSKVRIFEYQPRFLHAKTIIVDGWVCVGSTNLNSRSLYHDLELDVVLRKKESRELVVNQFISDLSMAKELSEEDGASYPWWKRVLARVFLFFRFWI